MVVFPFKSLYERGATVSIGTDRFLPETPKLNTEFVRWDKWDCFTTGGEFTFGDGGEDCDEGGG
jgi:hypothetical protein